MTVLALAFFSDLYPLLGDSSTQGIHPRNTNFFNSHTVLHNLLVVTSTREEDDPWSP